MSKEAMKLWLEALNVAEHFVEEYAASKYYFAHIAAKTSLEEALAKQEQGEPKRKWQGQIDNDEFFESIKQEQGEPVAYTNDKEVILAKHWTADYPPEGWEPLYTTPQQRTWVGLTDEEANELWESTDSDWELMKRVEAKLKEKNT